MVQNILDVFGIPVDADIEGKAALVFKKNRNILIRKHIAALHGVNGGDPLFDSLRGRVV